MTLQMGSPAPSIKVENWLRGEPLTNLQPGTVYLLEFWATWCGPCVAAMPHLVQLQEKYTDSGLEVVGVAASEKAPAEAQTMLDAWLTEKFSNLNFRMAFDSTGEMKKLWMEPSFSFWIPTSFVVDGHIAFIGPPMHLAQVLSKVRLIRAQESYCLWEAKSDATLLADFIVTRKERHAIRGMGYPDPDVLWRLDMFYTAVGLAIAERSGLMISPMTKMKPMGPSDDCVSRPGGWSLCRDIHRFGFATFRKLAEAGTKLVNDATAAIEVYPGVARAWRNRFREGSMSKLDEMRKKVRKLQLRAAIAKMKLSDLAEKLPGKWTEIVEVAEEASAVFAELDGARRELAAMKKLR
ncbi:DUF269 domain-containing protein [Mesorhizobium sp. M0179]|uniref:CCE_0567 family metalloprotein n=2 Tax=Mesorhizobium TaxID=68287 RepID=UPI00333DE68A